MQRLTLEEFLGLLKQQQVPQEHLALICPMCGTIQSAADLIAAGAGSTFDEVEKYLGFSCVGRFTHGKPPPKKKGTQTGCDWTLGGLLRICDLIVITPDGEEHPRFMPASPEEAQRHHSSRP